MKIFNADNGINIGARLVVSIVVTSIFILSIMITPRMMEAREVFDRIALEAGFLNHDTLLRALPKLKNGQTLEEQQNLDAFFEMVDDVFPAKNHWSIFLCIYAFFTVVSWVLFVHAVLISREITRLKQCFPMNTD